MDLLGALRATSTNNLRFSAVNQNDVAADPDVGHIEEPNTGTSSSTAPGSTAPAAAAVRIGPMPPPPNFIQGGTSSAGGRRLKRIRTASGDADANLEAFNQEPSTGGFFDNSMNMTNSSPRSQWETLKGYFSAGSMEEEGHESEPLERRNRRIPQTPRPTPQRTPASAAPTSAMEVEEIEDTPPNSPAAQENVSPPRPPSPMTVGPLYEAGEKLHPKVLKVLSVGKEDHATQLDYLETSSAPPLMTELDKLSEKQFDRSSVQIEYYSRNMFMEGMYRRHLAINELNKQKELTNNMAAEVNRVKAELMRVAEEKRLADDVLKTAEARLGKLQEETAALKKELEQSRTAQAQEQEARLKALADYEKLRTSLPAIAGKVLASAEVQEPFIRLVVAAQDCGALAVHKALVGAEVVLPEPLPASVGDLLKQDCEERFQTAGNDLKTVKAKFIDEIGGPIPVSVEAILGRLP